jgi:hypothetical protein
LRAVALAAGISRRVLCDTRVIFITIIAIYIALAEKIGTPLITMFSIVIGCTIVLPMVLAPKAIVERFLSIGSSILSSHLLSSIILVLILSGVRPVLPMVIATEGIRGSLQPVINSNISSGQLFLFVIY